MKLPSNQKLIILMGIPGSGKSTKAKQLAPESYIFETDDFWFDKNGKYIFDLSKIKEAHNWNQKRVDTAMDDGIFPIVVSNTSLSPKERQPYIDLANKHGYSVEIAFPDSPWFNEIRPRLVDKTFTDEDVQLFVEKTIHGVPFATIKAMMLRYDETL